MPSILITGANRGIGLELSRRALAGGWEVFGTAREPSDPIFVDLAKAHPGRFTALELEVRSEASVRAAHAAFGDRPLDVLVNNAGIIGPDRQSTLDMDFEGFSATLETNTLAPLRLAQVFLPNIAKSERGRIVTITSGMGSISRAGSDRIAYRASKAAVNMVMKGLAADLRPRGISVAVIHPGWVRTDMGGPSASLSPRQSADGLLQRIEELNLDRSGSFMDYSGAIIAW